MSSISVSNLFGVDGIVAVVTGGGSGMGYMIAKGLVENGAAKVYVLGDNLAVLEKAAKENGSPNFIPVKCDVTSKEDLQAAVDKITLETGYINLLVCNAGQAFNHKTLAPPMLESSISDIRNFYFSSTTFEEQLDVLNLIPSLFSSRHLHSSSF